DLPGHSRLPAAAARGILGDHSSPSHSTLQTGREGGMPGFKSLSAIALVVSVVLLGTGRVAAEEELVAVSGRVILNGKPLPEARVIFHVGDGQFVGGKTDEEGKYKVARVPAGTHKVTVEMLPGSKVKLPDRYSSERQSELRVEVKKGDNLIHLDLSTR